MRKLLPVLGVVVVGVGIAIFALRPTRAAPRHTSPNTFVRPAPKRDAAIEAVLVDVERAIVRGNFVIDKAPAAIVARGDEVAEAWRLFGDSAEALVDEEALHTSIRTLNERFLAAHIDYQLELRFVRRNDVREFGVLVHRIDEATVVHVDNTPHTVLGLRRADGVVLPKGALGLETRELGAVVMLDPIASYAVTDVLPLLAPQADAAIRAELTAALGADASAAARIAVLVEERNKIVHEKWKSIRFNQPIGLFLDDKQLAVADDEPERARVDEIEVELERLGAGRIATRLESLVIQSVRRHEAWHLVDMERATQAIDFTQAETAAYLAQILSDPVTPHLTLWGVAYFAKNAPNSVAGKAGRTILDGLAKHDGEELRAAARALWTELYGQPPPNID